MTTRPVGKIEVWEPGAGSALYSITDFVSLYYREILTSGVGNFTFRVYSHLDFSGTYTYPNIDVGDTVKIWLDWDAVAGAPNFIGKVTKRSGPIKTPTGWVREISGLSQGEVLLRRFKRDKLYTNTNASAIVTEWATDLGLEGDGTKITADTNKPDIEVRTKTYFDLLRHISDYWLDASNKIKKDFWVDLDGDLVWKVRPLRTVGVESLGASDFLVDPQVIRDVESVKNDIVVYGAKERTEPALTDLWCESLTNWVATTGTLALDSITERKGTYCIKCTGPANDVDFHRTFSKLKDYGKLVFWVFSGNMNPTSKKARILAPDTSNYFEADIPNFTSLTWKSNELNLGADYVYDVDSNPSGIWTETGSPRWYNMQGVGWAVTKDAGDAIVYIDGALCFTLGRYKGTASDSGGGSSQALYGIRDHEVTDDKLHSDSECARRAETLLFMLKDLPIQIKIAVLGNDNVLVGDRLTMTIPSESITAQPYDVIAVENFLNLENWITQATMVNSVNIRQPLPSRPLDYIARARRQLRELAMEEKRI